MKRKTSMLLRRGLALALSTSILLGLTACGRKPAETAPTEEPFTAQDALAYMDNYKETMNYENAASELSETHTTQISGDTYVRMQQYYQGIPVYGRTVVCAADENGEVTSVIGNLLDIDPTLDLTPTITLEQAEESLRAYMTEEMSMESVDDFSLSDLGELCIYTVSEPQTLAYEMSFGTWQAIIDAHDASVLSAASTVSFDEVWYTGPEGSDPVLGAEPIDGEYVLMDAGRNIYISDGKKKKESNVSHTNFVTSPDTIFGDDTDSTSSSGTAYKFLNELGNVHDFYLDTLGTDGPPLLLGVYDVNYGIPFFPDGKNATGGWMREFEKKYSIDKFPYYAESQGEDYGFIYMGFEYSADIDKYLDILGHEYAHIIFFGKIGSIDDKQLEVQAINEAHSDIMGEIYQESCGAVDWQHSNRNHRNPAENGYPSTVNEAYDLYSQDKLPEDFSHGASTVISHAAYLMWNGIDGDEDKKLTYDQLAQLWYRMIAMMPSDCDFKLCRYLAETAALSMEELTDAQRACVSEAFEQVEIPPLAGTIYEVDYHVTSNGLKLQVATADRQAWSAYRLTISGFVTGGNNNQVNIVIPAYVYHEVREVPELEQDLKLNLNPGRYVFTISNPHYPERYTFTVEVDPAHTEDTIIIISAYGHALQEKIDTELVTDAFTDVRMMKYGEVRCFHIPQINAEVCAEVNETIFRTEMDALTGGFYDLWDSGFYENFDFDFDFGLGGLGYLCGEKNGVVSILMCRGGADFSPSYETYYTSIQSGEMLSKVNLLEACGMSEEEWAQKSEEALRKRWSEVADSMAGLDDVSLESLRKSTFSEENLADIKPFLLEDGSLAMLATIFTLAGDGVLNVTLNVETGEDVVPVFCDEEHTEFTQEELITVEEAKEFAAKYWGFESVADITKNGDAFVRYNEDYKQRVDGVLYYVIYLQAFIEIENESEESSGSTDSTETTEASYTHLSTMDCVFVNTATGEIGNWEE